MRHLRTSLRGTAQVPSGNHGSKAPSNGLAPERALPEGADPILQTSSPDSMIGACSFCLSYVCEAVSTCAMATSGRVSDSDAAQADVVDHAGAAASAVVCCNSVDECWKTYFKDLCCQAGSCWGQASVQANPSCCGRSRRQADKMGDALATFHRVLMSGSCSNASSGLSWPLRVLSPSLQWCVTVGSTGAQACAGAQLEYRLDL